ncbi:hypothetical protein [Chryseobacterium foetidum]|uniref:hypothetical protein n=1 Tax=Chryseobacterium foetidum TaxID=2951057 RepID=UPI0021C5CC20|nr:hypothetical protein [Chryseobacterium foetidum]
MSVKVTFRIPHISELWTGMYEFPESPIVGDSVDIVAMEEIPGKKRSDVFTKILEQEFKPVGKVTDRQWKKSEKDGVYLYVTIELIKQQQR